MSHTDIRVIETGSIDTGAIKTGAIQPGETGTKSTETERAEERCRVRLFVTIWLPNIMAFEKCCQPRQHGYPFPDSRKMVREQDGRDGNMAQRCLI